MPRPIIDIVGNTYKGLKVIAFSHIDYLSRTYWKVECTKCGAVTVLRKDNFAYKDSFPKFCECWYSLAYHNRKQIVNDKEI